MKHARLHISAFFAAFILFIPFTSASAQNAPFDTADRMDTSVHMVMSGGFWSVGSNEGFFRIVVIGGGVEHVSHRIFIQWLKSNPQTQGYDLVRTVNVKELNLANSPVFEVQTFFGEINAFNATITAKTRDGQTRRYNMTIKGNGEYKIE